MVASISNFSRLDTRNQGYIENLAAPPALGARRALGGGVE